MLAHKMYERKARERRHRVVEQANAFGLAMGGTDAQRRWQASENAPDLPADVPVDNHAIAAQAATIGRLRALYGAQNPKSALRNAIRVKKPD